MNFGFRAQKQYERFSSEMIYLTIERRGSTRIGMIGHFVMGGCSRLVTPWFQTGDEKTNVLKPSRSSQSSESYGFSKLLHAKPISRIFTLPSPLKSMFGSQFRQHDVVPNFLQTVSGSLIGHFFQIIQIASFPWNLVPFANWPVMVNVASSNIAFLVVFELLRIRSIRACLSNFKTNSVLPPSPRVP